MAVFTPISLAWLGIGWRGPDVVSGAPWGDRYSLRDCFRRRREELMARRHDPCMICVNSDFLFTGKMPKGMSIAR